MALMSVQCTAPVRISTTGTRFTHGRMQPEEKLAANIRPGLVRLSVGLEYVDDLIDDLKQALAR